MRHGLWLERENRELTEGLYWAGKPCGVHWRWDYRWAVSKEKYSPCPASLLARVYNRPARCQERPPVLFRRRKFGLEWRCRWNRRKGRSLWWRARRWREGKKHGRHVGWYPSGAKYFESNWWRGTLHGKHTNWYRRRGMKFTYKARMGKVEGQRIHWYPNGTKRWVGLYRDGQPCGLWRCWSRQGKPRPCPLGAKERRAGCRPHPAGSQCPPCR